MEARDARLSIDCASALDPGAGFDSVVDVRSPAEFAQDHLPGAINCPVLDDAERAQVGTLHQQVSAFEARRVGAALVARNIARILASPAFVQPRTWRPLIYCWRGGQRSGALAFVLARIGWPVRQLDGGYRAYRRQVLADLDVLPAGIDWRVVCGPTGSGKSRLLEHLRREGAQVLDLEALACHRGSVLGGLPACPQPSQRAFESALWQALRALDPGRPVFVESESRKVGNLHVPERLIEQMRAAACVRIELPQPARVALLRHEYRHFELAPTQLLAQLECLRALHGHARIADWTARVQAGDWDGLVERLLDEHYDPAYRRSQDRNFAQLDHARVVRPAGADESHFTAAARELIDSSR
jgi:tRNA 2-selenouridine synthase